MSPEQQHNWTEEELWVVCVCYKENLPVELALRLTNTTNELSMKMRYKNCLYLDKGPVEDALSHASKTHMKVWQEVEALYAEKKPLGLVKEETKEEQSNCETMLAVIFVAYLTIMLKIVFG